MTVRRRTQWLGAAVVLAVLAGAAAWGHHPEIVITRYRLAVPGVTTPVRLAVVSDTHSCVFADHQQEIAHLVRAEQPDVIALAGDIIDDDLPFERGFDTVRGMPAIAPTFYVTGNHEFWSGQAPQIKATMASMGIEVLAGDSREITVRGQRLSVAGLDDPAAGPAREAQVERLRASSSDAPRLLLAHRPEQTALYESLQADVIVSGHAHGGQWRAPVVLENGLFAPNQGLFPRLTGGVHQLAGGRQLVISRGLARESTPVPRLHNPPEIVVADLEPA